MGNHSGVLGEWWREAGYSKPICVSKHFTTDDTEVILPSALGVLGGSHVRKGIVRVGYALRNGLLISGGAGAPPSNPILP